MQLLHYHARDPMGERRTDTARNDVLKAGPLPVNYTDYVQEEPSLIAPDLHATSGCGVPSTRQDLRTSHKQPRQESA